MALLMPTAPMAAGLRRPTMMVSTIDIAIQPNSESTTGMASTSRAANSLRKRVAGLDDGAGERESMCLVHLNRSGSGNRDGRAEGELCCGKFKMVKSLRRREERGNALADRPGEMAEWLKAHAWKACVPQGT